jgi:hypothetical protein
MAFQMSRRLAVQGEEGVRVMTGAQQARPATGGFACYGIFT